MELLEAMGESMLERVIHGLVKFTEEHARQPDVIFVHPEDLEALIPSALGGFLARQINGVPILPLHSVKRGTVRPADRRTITESFEFKL